jgi:peptidyl-prolyl cis-trans isomerase SurA
MMKPQALLNAFRVISVFALVVALVVPAAAQRRRVIERIIARVNQEIVTKRQFERERERLREQLAHELSGPQLEEAFQEQSKHLLRDLIDQALMVQKAKDLDISVETDLVRRLDDIRKNFGLETLEALQSEVERQGILWEDFRDQIRRQLLMRELMGREVGRTIVVSREDARKYFEENKERFNSEAGVLLGQILVTAEDRTPEEAEARAREAWKELEAGQKWNEIVAKYSDDKTTASRSGDIGFARFEQLAGPIRSVIEKMETNQYTEPLKVGSNFLILRVFERRSGGVPTFEEVEARVMEEIYSRRMQPALRQYLANLRKESYIFLAPGYVDTGAERPTDAVLARKGE